MTRPPAPQPLPYPVVDGHTHLDHARSGEDALETTVALDLASQVGVTRMVQIGCDLAAARWTAQAVQQHERLVGGVALHPTEAAEIVCVARKKEIGSTEAGGPQSKGQRRNSGGVASPSNGVGSEPDCAEAPGISVEDVAARLAGPLEEILRLASQPRIRVVGETGLDHYWVRDPAGRLVQEVSFRRHIDLAKRLGKVLQIHDRDAHGDVLRVLHDEGPPEHTVFHCFSGDVEMARHCVDQGWFLSFGGTLTFKNAEPLRQALRAVPLEQVLVETDAPYLAPVPYRGRTNAGYLVPLTVRCMAEVLGHDLEHVCRVIDETSTRLYGPW
jgi:TatD DNase family protein